MFIDEFRDYCLSLKGVEETFPFDEHTLVFKVMNKVFAITSLQREEFTINLKCDPEKAIQLREQYPEIIPGFHMNKRHWNTVSCEGELSDAFLQELIVHSYDLIVAKLPKKDQQVLSQL